MRLARIPGCRVDRAHRWWRVQLRRDRHRRRVLAGQDSTGLRRFPARGQRLDRVRDPLRDLLEGVLRARGADDSDLSATGRAAGQELRARRVGICGLSGRWGDRPSARSAGGVAGARSPRTQARLGWLHRGDRRRRPGPRASGSWPARRCFASWLSVGCPAAWSNRTSIPPTIDACVTCSSIPTCAGGLGLPAESAVLLGPEAEIEIVGTVFCVDGADGDLEPLQSSCELTFESGRAEPI